MITFRPGKREDVVLWINLIGGTGSGKSYTAMRLASGISGDKPFAVIDTENRRALHYADKFRFDHAELRSPFRPAIYAEAVADADKAGYPVIVVDSGSHVWDGDGGVLDWQEEELSRMAGDDYKKREACKMASWIKPKGEHRRMVNKMLSTKAHIILCLRAAEKIEMVRGEDGKMRIVPKRSLSGLDGWIPICDSKLPFEATCSFLLMAKNPGVPLPIKLQEQHKSLFSLDKPITEESGRLMAEWAAGGSMAPPPKEQHNDAASAEQKKAIFAKMKAKNMSKEESAAMKKFFCDQMDIEDLNHEKAELLLRDFDSVFEAFCVFSQGEK